MDGTEGIGDAPLQTPPACIAAYHAVMARAGAQRSGVLQTRAPALAIHVRRAAACNPAIGAAGGAALHWLEVEFGQADEGLRRASVAALALGLDARTVDQPAALRSLHPGAHARLSALLGAGRPYGEATFARDIAFAAGFAAPAGPVTVTLPDARLDSLAPRARRAAGAFCRQVLQYGSAAARAWLGEVGARPWAELHVDVRTLQEFDAEGFRRCYHRLAALMRARPDLAGVYGASWLYDPQLAVVSPELAFARRTAEDGGGRLVRLRSDPAQTAFAVARSPARRRLVESGAYRPVCYAMFWTRRALLDWSARASARASCMDAAGREG